MPRASRNESFTSALADAQRHALIEALVSSPNMTLGELNQVDGPSREIIEQITIGELCDFQSGDWAEGGSVKAAKRKPRAGKYATRTKDGREEIDNAVFKAVRAARKPVRAEDVKDAIGTTPAQLRRSLARLVAAKKLKRSGNARATTYQVRK